MFAWNNRDLAGRLYDDGVPRAVEPPRSFYIESPTRLSALLIFGARKRP